MRILALGCHPDDIEFGCGGTLSKYAKAGHEIYMMVMTQGHAGGDDDIRRREQERAADILGCKKLFEFPQAVAYGKAFPEFWVQTPIDGQPPSPGNGTHFCFLAGSKEAVHAFYEAALAAGATEDGAPGPRPLYGDPYYGGFVRDLDGHKIEAAVWDESAGAPA